MSQSGLENFRAYKKARELFDLVVTDMSAVKMNRYATAWFLSR